MAGFFKRMFAFGKDDRTDDRTGDRTVEAEARRGEHQPAEGREPGSAKPEGLKPGSAAPASDFHGHTKPASTQPGAYQGGDGTERGVVKDVRDPGTGGGDGTYHGVSGAPRATDNTEIDVTEARDPDAHAEAAGNVIADEEAGADVRRPDEGGIVPLAEMMKGAREPGGGPQGEGSRLPGKAPENRVPRDAAAEGAPGKAEADGDGSPPADPLAASDPDPSPDPSVTAGPPESDVAGGSVTARADADAVALERDGVLRTDDLAPAPPPAPRTGIDDARPRRFSTADLDAGRPSRLARPAAVPAASAPAPEAPRGFLARLRSGLGRSSRELSQSITGVFRGRPLDDDTLEELEDVLLRADLGTATAGRIVERLAEGRHGRTVEAGEVRRILAAEIERVLVPVAEPLEIDLDHRPHVVLVVGVNGTGKTTTIGKLAAKLRRGGLDVMLAAGDTFRAAAIEQLHLWGERVGAEVVSTKLGADAAGLAHEAHERAVEAGADVLLIDTAGRLQNRAELMEELAKMVRVLRRRDPSAPHTVLQTLDATTGQNALQQVEAFRETAGVGGLVMTKLDGTSRGGVLVAVAARFGLPVWFLGVGEGVDDLEPFHAREFAAAIAGADEAA